MQQASFAATALEEQATSLAAREQTLQMELERLRDPQRVADAAKRPGMVIPQPRRSCDLGAGKVSGDVCARDSRERHQDHRAAAGPAAELDPDPIRRETRRRLGAARVTASEPARARTRSQGGGQRDHRRDDEQRR